MLNKFIASAVLVGGLTVGFAGQAGAGNESRGCTGLNVAHDILHGTGSGGELALHDVREHSGDPKAHHC